jgi:hypothetical protein
MDLRGLTECGGRAYFSKVLCDVMRDASATKKQSWCHGACDG